MKHKWVVKKLIVDRDKWPQEQQKLKRKDVVFNNYNMRIYESMGGKTKSILKITKEGTYDANYKEEK